MYVLKNRWNDTCISGSYHVCLEYAKTHKNEMGGCYVITPEA